VRMLSRIRSGAVTPLTVFYRLNIFD
jgi:hypothetical protein